MSSAVREDRSRGVPSAHDVPTLADVACSTREAAIAQLGTSTMPEAAPTYALPAGWRQRLGTRRYGFHGLSHAYAAGRAAAALLERDVSELRLVTCHLGAGASLCAVRGGRSVDTTMGFTPLEGLVMSTRSGNVDPGPAPATCASWSSTSSITPTPDSRSRSTATASEGASQP
jgi:hypothetical protein